MSQRVVRVLVLALALLSLGLPAVADQVDQTVVAFSVGDAKSLDVSFAGLRVTEMTIAHADRPLLAGVLPPYGGKGRFSWLEYSVRVENPTEIKRRVAVQVRLIDANGAVIDEFSFDGSVRRGRFRVLDTRRLTLNYAVPLVEKVELVFSAR